MVVVVVVVKRGHAIISSRNSGMVILLAGLHSKILRSMESSSGERGRIFRKKFGSRKYARKVESSTDARFHGLRPHVRLTRMTPRDQTSFGADA